MPITDLEYCAGNGLLPSLDNLAFVARVRAAGDYLRARALRRVGRQGGETGLAGAVIAAYDFEDHCVARRIRHQLGHVSADQRLRIQLRAASPMRPCDRQTDDVDGLDLFDHTRSPAMI